MISCYGFHCISFIMNEFEHYFICSFTILIFSLIIRYSSLLPFFYELYIIFLTVFGGYIYSNFFSVLCASIIFSHGITSHSFNVSQIDTLMSLYAKKWIFYSFIFIILYIFLIFESLYFVLCPKVTKIFFYIHIVFSFST